MQISIEKNYNYLRIKAKTEVIPSICIESMSTLSGCTPKKGYNMVYCYQMISSVKNWHVAHAIET